MYTTHTHAHARTHTQTDTHTHTHTHHSRLCTIPSPVLNCHARAQISCRFDFIRIFCSYPEFVSLNLPLMPDTIEECVSTCDHAFKRRHYPAWVLLSNVQDMLDPRDKTLDQKDSQ